MLKPPPILALDAGNTRLKAGWFLDGELVLEVWNYDDPGVVAAVTEKVRSHGVGHVGIGSVQSEPHEGLERLLAALHFATLHRLGPTTPSFLTNAYATPETLGVDRWMAVHGARLLFSKGRVLAIDVGTAITYDYLNAADEYLGGGISPGMRMRYQALHAFTARLPRVEPADVFPSLIGATTQESIRSGVEVGILSELEALIETYRALEASPLQVVLTGGDAPYFEKQLKSPTFADPALVVRGILTLVFYRVYGQKPSPASFL